MAAERARMTTIHEPDHAPGVDVVPFMETRPLVWSSIVAGFLIGLTTWALLNLLGIALGLTAFNAGQAAAQGSAPAGQAGMNTVLWTGITSIISYLIGGFAVSRIAHIFGRDRGAGNGVMVFLLSVPFALFMAGLGASGVLGGIGGLAGGIAGGAADVMSQNPSLPNQATAQAQANISPADVARAAEAARNAAWGGLIGALLAMAASALGGFFGAHDERREVREVHTH